MTNDERANGQGGPEAADILPVRRPPRPPKTQPKLRLAWDELFRAKKIEKINKSAERVHLAVTRFSQFIQLPTAPTRILSSPNWSGGSIVPHDGNQIVLQFGQWRVPKPTPPPHPDQKILAGQYSCSTWIGLDGDRRYVNSSLPQIGTEQHLDAITGKAQYNAFFQWWSPWESNPMSEYYKLPIPDIDDTSTIMAMLWAFDPKAVSAALAVFGAKTVRLFEQTFTAPDITLPGPIVTKPVISGATAEWIVERPLDIHSNSVPFPNYNETNFDFCVVGTARDPGIPTGEEVLDGPRLLRMFETPPDAPSRTRMISHAKRTGPTSLKVSYDT